MRGLFVWSAAVAVLASFYSLGILWTAISWASVVVFGAAGLVVGAAIVLNSGNRYHGGPVRHDGSIANALLTKLMTDRATVRSPKKRVVVSRNLDLAIEEIIDLVVRDYVMSWYQDLAKEEVRFTHILHDEVWHLLGEFAERFSKIDLVKFMAEDVVRVLTDHFKDIRMADPKKTPDHLRQRFSLHPWLASEEREEEFLRKVSEIFLIYLTPESYKHCASVRHLLREILAVNVFKPAVALICDPDYINTKVYEWFDYKEQLALEHKKTYTYAATYEDFMRMLKQCKDIEHLKHVRYNIISEIMQATTIQNLKRAKGIDVDKEWSPKGTTKGDLLRARNLSRYINQLTVAKNNCEKRIHQLGGPDYSSYTADSRQAEQQYIPGKKVYSFAVVIASPDCRQAFLKYLARDDCDALIRFWISVDSMKNIPQRYWHEKASEIYQMFVRHATSLVRAELDRINIKGMESFMMGNTGPEAFYEAQQQIAHILEERYYPSFILSDVYHRYIAALEAGASEQSKDAMDGSHQTAEGAAANVDLLEASTKISKHSTYAQEKLKQLDDKITNKSQAFSALRRSHKSDPKLNKLQEDIHNEIESLKTEKRQLESHLERTEVWIKHVGKWKAIICDAEVIQEDSKTMPNFVIVIDVPLDAKYKHLASTQGFTQGWVLQRTLDDFHALHQRLIQINDAFKMYELPSVPNSWFRSIDTRYLNKAKATLETYLSAVLKDESLAQSEAVFAFFSPSPEHLKQAPILKQKKFTLASFFKSLSSKDESDSDVELLFFVDGDGKEDSGLDSIATDLYVLLSEVFDMRGVSKWLRRTLMVFVKASFGRSINRQLRDTVAWLVSEPMLVYYLHNFRDAYWPDGVLAEALPPRTDEDKLLMRKQAKEKILDSIPDALNNLFGEHNAKQGAIKFFEVMQDIRLNKHLFYSLLEIFLYEAFEELKQYRELSVDVPDTKSNPSSPTVP